VNRKISAKVSKQLIKASAMQGGNQNRKELVQVRDSEGMQTELTFKVRERRDRAWHSD
jgi:hypothetical protein